MTSHLRGLPYRPFATTASQLKMRDFFQEKLLKVWNWYNFFYECNDDTTAFANRVM